MNSVPDFEAFRPYLTILVRGQIPMSVQSRLDASDIVQETLLEAHRKQDQYEGSREPRQIAGWLRRLLSCNLADALRTHYRQQRDVRRELDVQRTLDESSLGLDHLLLAEDTTPSQRLDRNFRALKVARALEQLPDNQKSAILLRYFQHASLEEIALSLETTKPATAGLLKRGLATLREQLREE
jgi:RNA polymerase sigma-70 factor (ECF subfamily)